MHNSLCVAQKMLGLLWIKWWWWYFLYKCPFEKYSLTRVPNKYTPELNCSLSGCLTPFYPSIYCVFNLYLAVFFTLPLSYLNCVGNVGHNHFYYHLTSVGTATFSLLWLHIPQTYGARSRILTLSALFCLFFCHIYTRGEIRVNMLYKSTTATF